MTFEEYLKIKSGDKLYVVRDLQIYFVTCTSTDALFGKYPSAGGNELCRRIYVTSTNKRLPFDWVEYRDADRFEIDAYYSLIMTLQYTHNLYRERSKTSNFYWEKSKMIKHNLLLCIDRYNHLLTLPTLLLTDPVYPLLLV